MNMNESERHQYVRDYAMQPGVTPEEIIGVSHAFAQASSDPEQHQAQRPDVPRSHRLPPHWVVTTRTGDIGCREVVYSAEADELASQSHVVELGWIIYGHDDYSKKLFPEEVISVERWRD